MEKLLLVQHCQKHHANPPIRIITRKRVFSATARSGLKMQENKHVFVHPALSSLFSEHIHTEDIKKRNGCTADRQKCELSAEGSLRGNILAYNGVCSFCAHCYFSDGRKERSRSHLSRICMQKPGHFAPIGNSRNEFRDALAPNLTISQKVVAKTLQPAHTRPPARARCLLAEFVRNTALITFASRRPRGNVCSVFCAAVANGNLCICTRALKKAA